MSAQHRIQNWAGKSSTPTVLPTPGVDSTVAGQIIAAAGSLVVIWAGADPVTAPPLSSGSGSTGNPAAGSATSAGPAEASGSGSTGSFGPAQSTTTAPGSTTQGSVTGQPVAGTIQVTAGPLGGSTTATPLLGPGRADTTAPPFGGSSVSTDLLTSGSSTTTAPPSSVGAGSTGTLAAGTTVTTAPSDVTQPRVIYATGSLADLPWSASLAELSWTANLGGLMDPISQLSTVPLPFTLHAAQVIDGTVVEVVFLPEGQAPGLGQAFHPATWDTAAALDRDGSVLVGPDQVAPGVGYWDVWVRYTDSDGVTQPVVFAGTHRFI